MKSFQFIQVGPVSNDKQPYKRNTVDKQHRERPGPQKGRQCEDSGKRRGHIPRSASSHWKPEEADSPTMMLPKEPESVARLTP